MSAVLSLAHEARPRDFAARFARARHRTLAMRRGRRHWGRRALVLLAAIAVPALARPESWQRFTIGDAGEAQVRVEPMPFEKVGDSFPGSAFYYLAPDEPLQPLAPGAYSDAENAPTLVDPLVGPIARAMRIDNSGVDRGRALDCLTAAIYYEAASEPDQGQRAVAQVILNRVAHPSFPNTVCGVVYQGSERTTGCQFSFTCDGSLARTPSRYFWARAMQVAQGALSGYVERSVGLATHYHTIAVHPAWDAQMNHITTLGAHMFFRWKSAAGNASAFRFAYFGAEPLPGPHARSAVADRAADPALDPLALERAYDAGLKAAQGGGGSGTITPAPTYVNDIAGRGGDNIYRAERLPPKQGSVRPEFENSGRWISQPGSSSGN